MEPPATNVPLIRQPMQPVSLDELASLFKNELLHVFEHVDVQVLNECPDLSQAPFHLAAEGLGQGKCEALDVGGVPNLVPTARVELPDYSIIQLCEQIGFQGDQTLVIGAASGPYRQLGTCCELIPNLLIKRDQNDQLKVDRNRTHYARIRCVKDAQGHEQQIPYVEQLESDRFTLLGNLLKCDGQRGPVIRLHVRRRITDSDPHLNGSLPMLLRSILNSKFAADRAVSLGGCFLMRRGRARMHIMPDFSKTPLCSDGEVDQWLKFFEFEAPLFCMSVLHSHDAKGLGLRLEHTHGYSVGKQAAGHLHYELTPEVIEYEAYFRPVTEVIRVDRPQQN